MPDEQMPAIQVGGRLPFRYSLGRLYQEIIGQLQKQAARQLQFKVDAASVLYWKWSDEASWKEVAELSDVSPAPATTIDGVSGLREALAAKRDSAAITITDVAGLDAALKSLGLWDSLVGKPSTFPPEPHGHAIDDVNGLREELDSKLADADLSVDAVPGLPERLSGLSSPQWSDIKGKPQTFAPEAHKHPISDVTGLQEALDAKRAAGVVALGDVTGLRTQLDSKRNVGLIPIADVDGLQAQLSANASAASSASAAAAAASSAAGSPAWADVKNKPTTFAPSAHKHDMADVNGLTDALAGKRAVGAVPLADVTGLQAALDAKRAAGAVPLADVTGLQAALDAKRATGAIPQSDVTGLVAALAALIKAEEVSGKVVTAGTKVSVKFAKTYSAPPFVLPSATWNGAQMVTGEASNITAIGCDVTVMQSTGTLLLNGSPFGAAPAGASFKMVIIGL